MLLREHLQGKMTHELASQTKAWTSLRGREVVALGRELLGGNGVVTDFLVRDPSCLLTLLHGAGHYSAWWQSLP